MQNLTPIVTTFWYAYKDGVLHEGVTESGQVTSVHDDAEFEHASDVAEKVAKYKGQLRTPSAHHPATPGLVNHSNNIVKLEKNDCEGKKSDLEAVEAKTT